MLTLIVIEDNADLNELLVESLTAQGYQAHGFAKVSEYEAQGLAGDLFLLDLNLPEEDGISFAARLKQERPEVGIVVLSARAGSSSRTASYVSGADTFLQKPCELDEIFAALGSAARRVMHYAGRRGEADRLVLSPGKMQIAGALGAVSLTADEVRLIVALQQAPGQRLSYAEIIRLLDPTATMSLPALEVRITRLHAKTKPILGAARLLRSIRKTGYQLVRGVEVAG